MEMRAGARLRSAVCGGEVVVLKEPHRTGTLSCGGRPMAPDAAPPDGAGPEPGKEGGIALGKRYVDDEAGLEVLCTKPGAGALEFDGRPLNLKGAKPLPSSD